MTQFFRDAKTVIFKRKSALMILVEELRKKNYIESRLHEIANTLSNCTDQGEGKIGTLRRVTTVAPFFLCDIPREEKKFAQRYNKAETPGRQTRIFLI